MTIKVLIVDPDIQFTVPIKKALEGSGDYSVDVYTTGQAGVEAVQRGRFDVAILDFGIDDVDLPTLIHAIRQEHPGLFILVSPRTDEHIMQLPTLDVQGSITKPYFARQLGPVIREALSAKARLVRKEQERRIEVQEAQAAGISIEEPPVQPDDTFTRMTQNVRSGDTGRSQAVIEEPDIPEEATIRDLVSGQQIPTPAAVPETLPEIEQIAVAEPSPALAMMALGAVVDDTIPLEQLAIPTFLSRIDQESGDQSLHRPIPAWVNQTPDDLDQPTLVEPPVHYDDTQPSERIRFESLRSSFGDTEPGGGVVQEKLESDQESQREPPPEPSVRPQRPLPELLDEPAFVASVIEETPPTAFPPTADADPNSEGGSSPVPPTVPELPAAPDAGSAPDTAAKLAVQLTQLSVDSTAQATLLTHGSDLVASAGDLSPHAIAGIVESINNAWQGASEQSGALIRYIHVPGVSDFLLYSTRTVEAMTLSMLFPGETPLRVIRRQAKQLMEALESVPDVPSLPPAEPEAAATLLSRPTGLRPPEGLQQAIENVQGAELSTPEPQPEPAPEPVPLAPRAEGPYTAYAFVWLPRVDVLSTTTADVLPEWVHMIAAEHGWQVDGVEVQPTYVTVQINIPANETPTATVETLMRETAARAEDYALWADAYYIVAPGRAVTQQEISNFMEYRRDAQDAA